MGSMKRHALRLSILAAFAIALQSTAPVLAAGNDTAIRLAMGPTSAPLKNQNQGQQASSETTGSAAKPHVKHKNKVAQ